MDTQGQVCKREFMKTGKTFFIRFGIIVSERYSIRFITLMATLPVLDAINLSFYASYSICQFICSLYLAGHQEVCRNLMGEQKGIISKSQAKFGFILSCIISLLIAIYLYLFARDFTILYFLSLSPFINLIGFRRTLAIESSGMLGRLASTRILSVLIGIGVSYLLFSSNEIIFLVSLSLLCDFLYCASVFVLIRKANIQFEGYADPHFVHISFRNMLLGLKPIIERIGILILANAALSGIYSLAFQIISSYVGILIYSFNSLIQIQSKSKKVQQGILDRGFLYIVLISLLFMPVIHLLCSHVFGSRWSLIEKIALAIWASKLIGIQNILAFNVQRKSFSSRKWIIFYLHIPFVSILVALGFHQGRNFGILFIIMASLTECFFFCGHTIFLDRKFQFRLALILASFSISWLII